MTCVGQSSGTPAPSRGTRSLATWPLAASIAVGTAFTLLIIEPRFRHSFPSLVDDWYGIANGPEMARHALALGNPEPTRYRPGWLIWNWLQWHTFGAPASFIGPQIWNVFRVFVLVAGLVLATDILARGDERSPAPTWVRWLLVTSVPVTVATVPGFAVDLARYGPQEPLLVGCTAAGAALMYGVFRRLSRSERSAQTAALAGVGFVLWTFGVLQKEPSISVVLLVPFVLLAIWADRHSWAHIDKSSRRLIVLVAVAMLVPLVPMIVRTSDLALADDHFYADQSAKGNLVDKFVLQVKLMPELLGTRLVIVLFALAGMAALAAWLWRGVDWLGIGLLSVGFFTVLFAAEVGVATSRYYLPAVCITAMILVRSAARIGREAMVAAAVVLLMLAVIQARSAHGAVANWVAGERLEEQVVREAAVRIAGGCRVAVTGSNVEMVGALPVLVPLAREQPRLCNGHQRFVVVIDGGGSISNATNDRIIRSCERAVQVAEVGWLARVLRCSAA